MERHKVVITGIGLITPVGNNKQENWRSITHGYSGTSLCEDPKAYDCPSKVVGVVKNEQPLINALISAKDQRKTDRFTHLAMIASSEALQDAQLADSTRCDRERFGVYLGVGIGGLKTILEVTRNFDSGGPRKVSPFMIPKVISNEAANWISMRWDLQGPLVAVTNACSSSADSIGLAYRAIRDGYADYMLAGGAESCITPVSLAVLGNMRALSRWKGDPKKASRPFDRDRTGFVLAEGSGMVVLERKDFAEKRGAYMYAEIVGYGATSDAHHITAMHPEGRGAKRAIELALKEANVMPENIGYVNAHGTGTPMNDAIETSVIKKVFGAYADPRNSKHLYVSSTKSMTGHMLGAAGGAEISYAALALAHQKILPTINREIPDEQCDLDFVTNGAHEASFDYAISNSFGFGGGNAVIVLKRNPESSP